MGRSMVFGGGKMKVKLIDYTKNPLKVLTQATLVSYWDEWSIDKLDKITEKDAELHIPRVLGYGHESILEHIKLTFAVEGCSRVCTHQLVRHRHASFVQASQRYLKLERDGDIEELFVIPESIKNDAVLHSKWREILERVMALYEESIRRGIPAEDARFIVPQAVRSKIVVSMNMREFKHFIGLRMCERAQWEIRELAKRMWEEVYKVDELKPILKWAKIGPKCIWLGYCPERELIPPGCWKRQREWWNKVWSI